MIEQIQGAGQSGKTGKSTKQGKNSLFAKLLAMLEKNAELSNKGKGLQAGKLSKGKGLVGLTEKSDPLAVAKSKHLLALASKEKLNLKDKGEDGAESLLVAHVLVDQKILVKSTGMSAKTSVLISGQLTNQTGELNDKQTALLFGEKSGQTVAEKGALNIGGEKSEQVHGLLNKMGVGVGVGKESDGLTAQQKVGMSQDMDAVKGDVLSTREALAKTEALAKADASAQADQKNRLLTEQGAKAAAQAGSLAQNNSNIVNGQTEKNVFANSMTAGKKAGAAVQLNHGLGEKTTVKKMAEQMNTAVAAAALFQQVKSSQPQQNQQTTQATLIAAGQANSADASLADSGSQSSDNKGGSDSRALNAAMVDVKASGSSSTQANFQNYLTSKSTPVMSPFDSMNHIAQSVKNGQTRLEIQLDPANLGKIQISLQSDASKQLQVHIIVDQSMTRAALEQQLPQLRNALAQQGFDLSGFSMESRHQQASSGDGGNNNQGRASQASGDPSESAMADLPEIESRSFQTGSGLSIRV